MNSPAPPRWVDFHCHLDLYKNHEELIDECDAARVATLTVTTTPKAWSRNQELAAQSQFVRVALGIHPQLVAEREGELGLFERYLPEARYVGEIGLDAGPRFYKSLTAQERVFDRVLSVCAEQGDKILTIHSVRAVAKVLNQLETNHRNERLRIVLHWFTGTKSEALRAVELGCYFSINAEMLKAEKHAAMIAELPEDRLLTETDGPFVEHEGAPIHPRHVEFTVDALADLRNAPRDSIAQRIVQNLKAVVS
jgi:TatD DNase family protein